MITPVTRHFRAASLWSALALLSFGGNALAALPHPLFKAAALGSTPDTLEVFCIYVQFASEAVGVGAAGDEAATTGTGTFGSDTSKSYALDPGANSPALREDTAYLEKHFEFAENYFNKASNGQVVIVPRFFPRPNGGRVPPITLKQHMKFYNPALQDKSQKQKTADFETQQAQALMTFVGETVTKMDATQDSASNPFRVAFSEPPSPHHYRAFLLFHAGASRLIDGGTLGPTGANTPNDFLDLFITQPDFTLLATADSAPGVVSPYRPDSLGMIVNSGRDTVSQFMMLSEQASQDGTNWGINGILVNQLAQQMGMPNLFDVVRGISQVGSFDVMDFAGYNTQSGFLPVFPSAWTRSFMGWDQPVNAAHGAGPYSQTTLYPADQPGTNRTRTLSIPLNEREYLLVENRQRSARDSTVTLYFSHASNDADVSFGQADSIAVPYAYIDSIFMDSLGGKPNPYKPKGIITGASHYDIGLPGSGLLVWHVNEWFLESFLKDGFVNAYLGDTLGSQYKGLELVEADGVPAIGKQFTDALGQPDFDYGTADDVLPHVFRQRKNPPTDTSWALPETLSVIGSYGFANTNSWNDGRTGIKLVAPLPPQPLFARSLSSFTGDSVFTLRDSALALQVWWPNDSSIAQPAGSVWPVRTEPSGNPQAVNVVHAAGSAAPYIVSASDTGMLQTYAASGKLALAARDTTRDPAHYDSVTALLQSANTRPRDAAPVNSIVDPAGAPLGVCVANDTVIAVLTRTSLRLIHPVADSLGDSAARSGGRAISVSVHGAVGPVAWDNKVFVVDSQGVLRWYGLNYGLSGGAPADSVVLPPQAYQALAGLNFGSDQEPQVVVAGVKGAAIRVDLAAHQAVDLQPAWKSSAWKDSVSADEVFSVVTSDFDRDSNDDVFLLGSKGAALLFQARADKQGQAFEGFPQRFPRSIQLLDAAGHGYSTEDRSSPALADLNRDGHPDILFSGSNAVYAIDWHGAWLPGWPFLPQPHQSVGLTYGSSLFPQTVISSTPLVLLLRQRTAVLLGSPDGLIYAVDSAGKALNYSSFNPSQQASTGVLMSNRSDWPLSAGGLSIDSTRSPYINLTLAPLDSSGDLNLLAQTASGSLNVWSLQESQATAGRNWLMPGGDAGRAFHFSAATLDAATAPGAVEDIQEFHLFPSPVRSSSGGQATVHLKIGATASKARVRVFSLSGLPVADLSFTGLTPGLQPFDHALDLSRLGPDVYSAYCEVWFPDGKKVSKWTRVGVVR